MEEHWGIKCDEIRLVEWWCNTLRNIIAFYEGRGFVLSGNSRWKSSHRGAAYSHSCSLLLPSSMCPYCFLAAWMTSALFIETFYLTFIPVQSSFYLCVIFRSGRKFFDCILTVGIIKFVFFVFLICATHHKGVLANCRLILMCEKARRGRPSRSFVSSASLFQNLTYGSLIRQ